MFSCSFPTFLNCCVTTLLLAYIGCLPDRNHRSPISKSWLVFQTCRHSTFAHDSDICCQNRSHNIRSPNRNLFISHPQQQPWLMTFDKFCRPKTDIYLPQLVFRGLVKHKSSTGGQSKTCVWHLFDVLISQFVTIYAIRRAKHATRSKKTSAEKNDVHCVQKNTPTHIFFYISMSDA